MQVPITVSNADEISHAEIKRVFSAKQDVISQAVICYNCGKKGHCARDSKAPKRGNIYIEEMVVPRARTKWAVSNRLQPVTCRAIPPRRVRLKEGPSADFIVRNWVTERPSFPNRQ